MEHTNPKNILLVEDTAALLEMYEMAMEDEGYNVTGFRRGDDALDYLAGNHADLILLDLKLPDMDGLELMRALHSRRSGAPVIVMTGQGSINTAVEAMRHGARDFLVKPFNIERLQKAVRNELDKKPQDSMSSSLAGITGLGLEAGPTKGTPHPSRNPRTAKQNGDLYDFGGFIGDSKPMQRIYEQIKNAAHSSATVFITGESGTGKEVCAETIHQRSVRANSPFVPINCAAIPRDLLESELFGHVKGAFTGAIAEREGAARLADGGTLFLDEIAEMNPDMQTKLLRFIQTRSFQKVGGSRLEKTDIRIICATNRDPLAEVRAGRFREDLFYRLHVLPLHMPPLRERGEDIMAIAYAFLAHYGSEERKDFTGFDSEAVETLRRYAWPGNVRQLQNVIQNIVVMNTQGVVGAAMLPRSLLHDHKRPVGATTAPIPFAAAAEQDIRPLAEIEREIIEGAIRSCHGNVPRAAAALGISPSTIYRKKAEWTANP